MAEMTRGGFGESGVVFRDPAEERADYLRRAQELRERQLARRERERRKERRFLTKVGAAVLTAAMATGAMWGLADRAAAEQAEEPVGDQPVASEAGAMASADALEELGAEVMSPETSINAVSVTAVEPVMGDEPVAEGETVVEAAEEREEERATAFAERAWEKFEAGEMVWRGEPILLESDLPNMISTYAEILKHAEEEGLRDEHIAGIMGNLTQESRFRIADGNGGLGLMQWVGPRREALYNFAAERGVEPTAMETQVDFMFYERWNAQGEGARWEKFLESETVDDAVESFCEEVERAGKPHMEARQAFGRMVADCMGME